MRGADVDYQDLSTTAIMEWEQIPGMNRCVPLLREKLGGTTEQVAFHPHDQADNGPRGSQVSTTEVGRANANDLPEVLKLLKESGLLDAGLHDHLATLLVARRAGQVVGSAALELHGSSALLRSVAVRTSVRDEDWDSA